MSRDPLLSRAGSVALAAAIASAPVACSPPAVAGGYIPPVTAAISSATTSGSFTPNPGVPFNITLTGTFVATCELDRQINGSWVPTTVSVGGSTVQLEQWTAPASDQWVEYQANTPYRVNCTSYTSGTVNVYISA